MSTATGVPGEQHDLSAAAPCPGAAGVETPGASEDSRARRAVVEDLDRTLFVEAGAGTGKTTALVGRIVELVRAGVALADIAAITFTEKAAAELRERLRQDLLARTRRADPGEADILGRALEDLDGAAVCTLHSFAQRILREHTTEAGLPPRPEMLDEIGADMEFADAWDRFVEEVLAEQRMERSLVMADALGMRMATLRAVARRMADNWDLAAERVPELGTVDEVPPLEFADLGAPMRSLADESRWHDVPLDQLASSQPVEPDDLYRVLVDLGRLADRLEGAAELEALALLEEVAAGRVPRGRKANWRRGFDKEAVRERLRELREEAGRRLDFVGRACADRLLARLAEFTLVEADRRRRQGRLIFHDLLVLARNLLRHAAVGEEVRRSLRDRYRRLLIDEFQDTDPIQVELALLIAGEPSDAGDGEGRLFFVGDPKQSLYRFRRADIGTYLQVADRVGPAAPRDTEPELALIAGDRRLGQRRLRAAHPPGGRVSARLRPSRRGPRAARRERGVTGGAAGRGHHRRRRARRVHGREPARARVRCRGGAGPARRTRVLACVRRRGDAAAPAARRVRPHPGTHRPRCAHRRGSRPPPCHTGSSHRAWSTAPAPRPICSRCCAPWTTRRTIWRS